ncbi:protein of unknown function (DUF4795) [Popillia japonica]|uniref:DUF4795 domain-containing protein n=1 Tax=Popillia japonica TaxID=7064 RepID=A0AAW1K357_POPJA
MVYAEGMPQGLETIVTLAADTVSEALLDVIDRVNNIESFLESTKTGFKASSTPSRPATAPQKGTPPPGTPGSPPSTQGKQTAKTSTHGSELGSSGSQASDFMQLTELDTSVPDFSKMSPEEFANAVRDELHKTKEQINGIYMKVGVLIGLQSEFSTNQIYSALKNVIKKHIQNMTGTTEEVGELPASERLERLEDRFNGTNEQIASLDSTFNHEINNIHSQFADMEKAFGNIMEKIHFGMPGGDSTVAGETLGELYDKLMGLQSDMENLAETASKLVEDKEDKQRLIEVLTEQVEFLKTVKADKEDLEDALADKADACAINRKVSHDQFDTACDELSKGIEDALGKLTQQEELWQQALNEIQKEIGNKLDRMELGPLRDFVNNKLKMLQQRLKALTALKKETEAAGTKKFLRNVQCISCDKDVVMRKEMDPSLFPQPYALPPSRSMGPYLAYELDALRKQQKSLPNSRNLNHFENALHQKTPRPGDDHICNRYCGGSHTITTPQQRVTRLGHFLNQWGPEAQAVTDVPVKTGKDDDKLAVVGSGNIVHTVVEETMAPKISKLESTEKVVRDGRKSSTLESKRGSTAPSEKRKSSLQKISGTNLKQGSAEAVSNDKRRSTASTKKERRSSAGSVIKESSGTAPGQIPEETPSEVAKEEETVSVKQAPRQSVNQQGPPATEDGEETTASEAPAEEPAPATEE